MALWRKSDTSKTAELKAVTKVDQTGEFTPPKPSKKKKTSPGKETSTKTPDSPPGFFGLLRQAMGLAFRVLFWAVFLVTLAVTGTLSVAWKHWQGSLTQVDAFCTLRRSTLEVTCSFRNRGLSSARRCVSFVAQRSKNKVKRRVCSRWLRQNPTARDPRWLQSWLQTASKNRRHHQPEAWFQRDVVVCERRLSSTICGFGTMAWREKTEEETLRSAFVLYGASFVRQCDHTESREIQMSS